MCSTNNFDVIKLVNYRALKGAASQLVLTSLSQDLYRCDLGVKQTEGIWSVLLRYAAL